MKIAIVGGGICGLTAGFFLSKKGHKVTIFEKEKVLGGLASCFKNSGWDWPLERYFHHFFSSDNQVSKLLKELGIQGKLFFKKPKTSIFLKGKIFRFDNPQSILSFPYFNLWDKIRTGIITLLLKANPFFRPLEKIAAFDFIPKTMGKNCFSLVWKPLLVGKFGSLASEIPASWFWTRIKKRSFSLGYLSQGNQVLIDALKGAILGHQGEIFLGRKVTKITKKESFFEIKVNQKKFPFRFDKVLAVIPPNNFPKIVPSLSLEEKEFLNKLKSLGSICLVLELKEKFLKDNTYWLNINDENFPFLALVEHTNFIESKYYNNHPVLYIGGYYPPNHRYFKMNAEQILKEFLPFLEKINPQPNFKSAGRRTILDFKLFKDSYAQPIVSLNYSQNLPFTKTSIPGLYWASLHHVYPQDRGVNYAIAQGTKIANEIMDS